MSRYIDEKDVYKLVEPTGIARVHCSQIDSLPRSDVVEVVRCRDCIHNRDNGGDCDRTIILNEYDSTEYRCAGLEYCSYAERKEE